MVTMDPKNFALGAAGDLGLGNMLAQQLVEQEDERRKKQQSLMPAQPMFTAASTDLLGKRDG